MWVGIGVGIGRNRFATGIFNAYALRVTADGGITEAGQCVDAVSSLLQSASLLLIPSGYKGGKLYSEIPTNGNGDLTWTRVGDAFRTNASGVIQRVPWNLLQQSETLETGNWGKTAASISSNATTAPNGTLTADALIEDTSNGLHICSQSITLNSSICTLSIYAKANGRNWMFISMVAASNYGTYFDLQNGVLGTVESNVTATITSVGNGWYRCTMTTNSAVSSARCTVYTATANGVNSYTGNGTSGLYLWGAQIVEGTTAQIYLPTTDRLNFPRLSYMYGSCPSALLEPQRTNLCLFSDDFTNSGWTKTNTTATANTTTSPDGTLNADTITITNSGSNLLFRQITVTASTTYTFSFWALRGTATDLKYLVYNYSGASVLVASTSYYSQTNSSTWSRISVTFTTPVGCTLIGVYPLIDVVTTGTFFIYGAQLEAGAYPTTYIPTTSATATRVADSFSRSNIYTNGLISASGGTWFVEFAVNNTNTRDNSQGMFVGDSTNIYTGNQLVILSGSTGTIQFNKVVSGTGTTLYQSSNSQLKFAIKWNGSTADIFANGTKVISATAFTATNMENLIGQSGTPFFVKQMALFNTPLTDTQCQTLTT